MRILFHCGYHPSDPGSYLEKAFSQEHKVTYCGPAYKFERPGFPKDLDLSNIEKKWDFFFYVDSYCPGFPLGIKKMPFPTVGYFLDTVYGVKTKLLIAPFFDYVFVDSKDNIEPFFKVNKNVFWLPYGCDPEIIYCNKNIKKIYDIGFVGTTKGTEREKVLADLAKYFKLNDYKRFYTREEMALIYNQSKIIFNQSFVEIMTMRTFEALSCGSLLLSKRVKDGADILFKEGEHFVAFGPEDDLIKIIKYYLSHDEEREKLLLKGMNWLFQNILIGIELKLFWRRLKKIIGAWKRRPGLGLKKNYFCVIIRFFQCALWLKVIVI